MAFSLAVQKGAEQVWIIGGGGGRVDHLFGIRALFEREVYPYRWTTDTADIHCIDRDRNYKLKIKSEKISLISVFPLGEGQWEAKSDGLKWPLDGLKWERELFSVSNEATFGDFSITAIKGRFMIILPLW